MLVGTSALRLAVGLLHLRDILSPVYVGLLDFQICPQPCIRARVRWRLGYLHNHNGETRWWAERLFFFIRSFLLGRHPSFQEMTATWLWIYVRTEDRQVCSDEGGAGFLFKMVDRSSGLIQRVEN